MKVIYDKSLRGFEFWGGAAEKAAYLTNAEMDELEALIEHEYPNGVDAWMVNELFLSDDDETDQWFGYDSFEEIMEERG